MRIAMVATIVVSFFATATISQADEIKPLTQQLKDSKVGKWLSVWGDYNFTKAHSSGSRGAINSNSLHLGLRSTPVKPLTLDISMLYSSDIGSMSDLIDDRNFHLDRGYATLNLMDDRLRIAAGRRPLGDSVPLSSLQNKDQADDRGNPSLLETYHYDGFSISYAPENLAFLGSHWRVGYGHGYELGNDGPTDALYDSQILTIALVPVNLDSAKVWFQWLRGFELFDYPVMNNTAFGNTPPQTNLGYIDWLSLGFKGSLKKIGPGDLHGFADFCMSLPHSNGNTSSLAVFQGLLSGQVFAPEDANDDAGYAVYAGIRYDLPTLTKIGFEYNHGSKYWIASAASKTGTRGNVYEPFIIQEINLKPVTSIFQKTFFRAGYQYYDYEYTGSNNWIGAPVKISDLTSGMLLLQAPISHSYSVYGSFEVHF